MRTLHAACGTLEPQLETHAAEMFEVLGDPAIYEFEGEPPASVEALAADFRRKASRRSPNGRELWLNWVLRRPDGALAGYVQASILPSGATYIGYEFASAHWRQGIGSAAVQAMLDELAQAYPVRTFVAVLKTVNHRSMGLLRKLGFTPATDEQARAYHVEADESVLLMPAPRQARPGP